MSATQLQAMLAKFNSSQEKVAQQNVAQAEQTKKPQKKKPPVPKAAAAAAAKPKDEKPAAAAGAVGAVVKEETKVKLKLKDQLKVRAGPKCWRTALSLRMMCLQTSKSNSRTWTCNMCGRMAILHISPAACLMLHAACATA